MVRSLFQCDTNALGNGKGSVFPNPFHQKLVSIEGNSLDTLINGNQSFVRSADENRRAHCDLELLLGAVELARSPIAFYDAPQKSNFFEPPHHAERAETHKPIRGRS